MKDFIGKESSRARVFKNPYHNFDAETWSGLIQGNSLLIYWFTVWIDQHEWDDDGMSLQDFMSVEYQKSSGGSPSKMQGAVDVLGDYVYEGDDDPLAAYFIIKLEVDGKDRLAYIYPYGIVAMPKADGGYSVVRMD